jgi:hypothetical protein
LLRYTYPFVIGIDPSTINPIIKTKYVEDSKIDGMKYLLKIVQPPYDTSMESATPFRYDNKHDEENTPSHSITIREGREKGW